jgi:hypothetical protein
MSADRSTRRAFLRASGNTLAAGLAASTVALPALAAGDPLLRLGAEWISARAAAIAANEEMDALYKSLAAEHGSEYPRVLIGSRFGGMAPADRELLWAYNEERIRDASRVIASPTWRDRKLKEFAEAEAAWQRTHDALGGQAIEARDDAAWQAVSDLEDQIMALPARDAAGVLVKLRVAMMWIGPDNFEGPESQMDNEHRYVLAVSRDLERLAAAQIGGAA